MLNNLITKKTVENKIIVLYMKNVVSENIYLFKIIKNLITDTGFTR